MATSIVKKSYDESESRITIGIASNVLEKMKIYHLRYQIYVEEMSKLQAAAFTKKLLYDELDDWGILLYAKKGRELIGTLRVNIGGLQDFSESWIKNLSLEKFQAFYGVDSGAKFAYSSKMMVSPAHRNSTAAHLLSTRGYELSCEHQFNFMFCNLYTLRFYEQLGFRRFSRNFLDPDYGLLAPLVLLAGDVEHMRTVRSPLLRILRKRKPENKRVVDWFYSEFAEVSNIMNSQLTTEEELWAFLQQRLGHAPERMMPILYGLSAAEARKFLHCCGVVVQCRPGDQIVTSGIPSYDLNILISGKLESPRAPRILPGRKFGANGLVEHPKQTEDITAATDAEILVLSSLAFPKFRHACPAAADRILRNTAGITNEAISL